MLSHADALWRSEGLEDTEKRLDRSRRRSSPFFPWKPTELVLKVFLGSPYFSPHGNRVGAQVVSSGFR